MIGRHVLCGLLLLAAWVQPGLELPVAAAEPTYWGQIRPIFRKHCTVCHNERRRDDVDISAGIALDSPANIRTARRGQRPVVVPGKPEESPLYQSLIATDVNKRMPLDADPLPAEAIATIRRWIAAGMPEGTPPTATATTTTPLRPLRRLELTLPTRASPPPALQRKGNLELALPIGPLPPVTALAFSPDGTRLASGSYGLLTVWDAAAGRPLWQSTQLLGAVHDVKFSPDGRLLAAGGGQPAARGEVRIFDAATGQLLRTLSGHADAVSAVAFSPDGRLLAAASFDKTVRLWETDTGKLRHTYAGHSDFVYGVAFAPNGEWYATASKDRTGRIVQTATGQGKLTFSGMNDEVLAVAVHPNGSFVLTSGYETQLSWWDPQTAERKNRTPGPGVAVHEIAFDAKGTLGAIAGGDGTVRLFNGTNGGLLRSANAAPAVFAVALDPTGKRLASGGSDGWIKIWDTAELRLLATLWSGPQQQWLALTPEGYWAAAEPVLAQAVWKAAGQPVADRALLQPLLEPARVAAACRGEKVPPPAWPPQPPKKK